MVRSFKSTKLKKTLPLFVKYTDRHALSYQQNLKDNMLIQHNLSIDSANSPKSFRQYYQQL